MPTTPFNSWVFAQHLQGKELTYSNNISIKISLLENIALIWLNSISQGCIRSSWISEGQLVLFFKGQIFNNRKEAGSHGSLSRTHVLQFLLEYWFTVPMVYQNFTVKTFHPLFCHNLTMCYGRIGAHLKKIILAKSSPLGADKTILSLFLSTIIFLIQSDTYWSGGMNIIWDLPMSFLHFRCYYLLWGSFLSSMVTVFGKFPPHFVASDATAASWDGYYSHHHAGKDI